MTFYIAVMINPEGEKEYLPENFGFGVHEHTKDIKEAQKHDTYEKAQQSILRYWSPSAFWGAEIAHAEKMKEKFKNWKFEIIELYDHEKTFEEQLEIFEETFDEI